MITDNDGNYSQNIEEKYKDYSKYPNINIFADTNEDYNTLEPQFVNANLKKLDELCKVMGVKFAKYNNAKKISDYMENNKTKWALKVFESDKSLKYPEYIIAAVKWCDDE